MTKINLYTADGKALTDITSADESISLPNASPDQTINSIQSGLKECFDTIEAHRVWLRKIEQQSGAYSENTGAVLADIMGRVETLEVTANKATYLLAQYRRMVGNLFRRVADLVDGG